MSQGSGNAHGQQLQPQTWALTEYGLATSTGNGSGGGGNVVRGMAAALEEEREAAEAAAMGRAVERRKWKAEQKDLLDEMLPAATAGTR